MRRNAQTGLGLTELMISLAVTGVLVTGSFYMVKETSSAATESVMNGKIDLETHKAFERLNTEMMNIVTLHPSGKKTATVLGNVDRYPDLNDPLNGFIPNGLAVYPGHTTSDFANESTPRQIDPSSASLSNPSDAVRIAYLAKDTEAVFLVIDPSSPVNDPAPFPTSQENGALGQIVTTKTTQFQTGDYAVIADNDSADLFRITYVDNKRSDETHLYHVPYASIWNQAFEKDYGTNGMGDAYVQKVKLATYAHDPEKEILYRDDHRSDDGFDPHAKTFSGNAFLAHEWKVAATNVKEFRILYELANGSATRTPYASPIGYAGDPMDQAADPGNQVGFPLLQNIRIEIASTSTDTRRTFSPINLRRGPVALRSGENLEGPPVLLVRAPTPTPTATVSGSGSGSGSGSTNPTDRPSGGGDGN